MERNLEVALVVRLQAGDTTAFDEIYDTLNPRLLSFLRRMARDRAVAEDLLEETWLRLVLAREDLRPDTRLVPWLFTVARNGSVLLFSGRSWAGRSIIRPAIDGLVATR